MSNQSVQAQKATGERGQFGELPQLANTVALDQTIKRWSQEPEVATILGDGAPLTDREEEILAILVDPGLDEYDDLDAGSLAENWETFDGYDSGAVCHLADRLRLHHERAEADPDCWVFQYIPDEDTGWYEVGSYVPGSALHATFGEDGQYLSGRRAGLTGLRAAIHAAAAIDDTWMSARKEMRELRLLQDGPAIDLAEPATLKEPASPTKFRQWAVEQVISETQQTSVAAGDGGNAGTYADFLEDLITRLERVRDGEYGR